MVRITVVPEGLRLDLRERHVHRCHHAVARRRIDAVANQADDLVARLAVRQANAYGPTDGLLAEPIAAHERVVDDGDERRAHAIAVGEVPAVHERRPHGFEPARGCGIAPESLIAPILYRHGPIVDGDPVGSPASAGEQRHPG